MRHPPHRTAKPSVTSFSSTLPMCRAQAQAIKTSFVHALVKGEGGSWWKETKLSLLKWTVWELVAEPRVRALKNSKRLLYPKPTRKRMSRR